MDDELKEICRRILDVVGDDHTVEAEDPDTGDVDLVQLPSELSVLLIELRDCLEGEQE